MTNGYSNENDLKPFYHLTPWLRFNRHHFEIESDRNFAFDSI